MWYFWEASNSDRYVLLGLYFWVWESNNGKDRNNVVNKKMSSKA